MRPITTAIGEVHQDVVDKLEQLISNNKNFNLVGSTTKDANKFLESIRQNQPELVILSKDMKDSANPKIDGLEICRQILVELPTTIVIITSTYEDPEDLRNSMKAGARDFISFGDFDSRLVSSSVELVTNLRRFDFSINDKKGSVISFISPKGGVGKTTIALNVAHELSQKLKAIGSNERVLVIDYSLQFGDVSFLSSIKPQRTISDLNDLKDIDKDAFEGHLIYSQEAGFHILSAPRRPEYSFMINSEVLKKVIPLARRLFDYIIVDTMTGLHESTIIAVEQSDFSFLVTTNQLVSLKSAMAMIETLAEEPTDVTQPSGKFKLIVNEVEKVGIQPDEISKRLKCPLIGSISKNDKIINDMSNNNKFITSEYKNTEISREFQLLSQNILSLLQPVEKIYFNNDVTKVKKGILSKLFTK